ncbi:unnamed protein product [Brassica oleracea]
MVLLWGSLPSVFPRSERAFLMFKLLPRLRLWLRLLVLIEATTAVIESSGPTAVRGPDAGVEASMAPPSFLVLPLPPTRGSLPESIPKEAALEASRCSSDNRDRKQMTGLTFELARLILLGRTHMPCLSSFPVIRPCLTMEKLMCIVIVRFALAGILAFRRICLQKMTPTRGFAGLMRCIWVG